MLEDFKPRRAKTTQKKQSHDEPDPESTTTLEPPFATPEQIAEHDEIVGTESPEPEVSLNKKRRFPPQLSKKQWIIVGIVSGLVLCAIGAGAYMLLRKKPVEQPIAAAEVKPEEPPKPTTEASRLTGVQISPELNALPTTGVMIENSPDARPQSGLLDAGVVFEAIAEGGITRFLVLFQEAQPDYIGPVRSVRPYYLDYLVPFDAPIAHAGGSAEALQQIRNQGIKDLDHSANGSTYHRVDNRYSPHDLYTSRAELLELQRAKGFGSSTFTGFLRKQEQPSTAPTARGINLRLSGPTYNVRYDYDAVTNNYKRAQAGEPHIDERSKTQLSPKVVVALVVPFSQSGIYSIYQTSGTGKVYVFQDGVVTEGTWSKNGRSGQLEFKDAAGAPLGLNPGQTWVTLVSAAADVQITP